MPLNVLAGVIDESARPPLPAQAAGEADHRIANHLMIIAGLIRGQAARLPAGPTLPTQDVRHWLEEMSIRIDAVRPPASFAQIWQRNRNRRPRGLSARRRGGDRRVPERGRANGHFV